MELNCLGQATYGERETYISIISTKTLACLWLNCQTANWTTVRRHTWLAAPPRPCRELAASRPQVDSRQSVCADPVGIPVCGALRP